MTNIDPKRKKFVETDEIRDFLENDFNDAIELYERSKTNDVQMDSGTKTKLAKCLLICEFYLEAITDRVDDYADQIRFLKEHSLGWEE